MTIRVELSEQVLGFVSQLAPEPRKRLRDALHKLAKGKAETKPLEGRLAGYHRLRSGSYRVIFHQRMDQGQAVASASMPRQGRWCMNCLSKPWVRAELTSLPAPGQYRSTGPPHARFLRRSAPGRPSRRRPRGFPWGWRRGSCWRGGRRGFRCRRGFPPG